MIQPQVITPIKRCPFDGVRLVKETIDDVEYWVCPRCGYMEPVNPVAAQ
jgi:rubrerythrin